MNKALKRIPTLTIAALRGGGGKTIASLGIIRALKNKGLKIACFKKGPDYIDAAWLAHAAKDSCYNLDPYFMSENTIQTSFSYHSKNSDIAVIEGNRGLFDGMDIDGSCSTSKISKLLSSGVILVVDCTKSTRTIAALVLGCINFEKDVNILGVILNQVAGKRHKKIVTGAIEKYTGLPVFGAIPRLKKDPLPMRHLGVTPAYEYKEVDTALENLANLAQEHLNLDQILQVATKHSAIIDSSISEYELYQEPKNKFKGIKIGIIKDRAFQFYYPENINVLKFLGAEIIFLDSLNHQNIPSIDALYIGGGFPETQAKGLERNKTFRKQLKSLILKGLPVYAECGGLMYLGQKIIWESKSYNMVGALPIDFIMKERPVGHGYSSLIFEKDSPFFKKGEKIKGHEFHYSKPILKNEDKWRNLFCCKVERGYGFDREHEGFCYKNVFGTYSHCHFLAQRNWAKRLLEAAQKFKINSDS